jgi:hypothetical protein
MSGLTIFGFGVFVGAGIMYAITYFTTHPNERKALWSRLRAKASKAIAGDAPPAATAVDPPKVP